MEIQTDRLIVRAFRPDDWRDLFDYLSRPEIYEFEPGVPIDAEEARVMAVQRSKGRAFWAVEFRAEGRMIGHLYFQPVEPEELETYELGYIFDPAYQRHGYATEAARALVDDALAGMGVRRVIAQCSPANTASWRVLEKIGFVREGHLRQNIFFRRGGDGRPIWQDTFEYGRLHDPGARGALQLEAAVTPPESAPGREPSPMTHPARHQVRVRLVGELPSAWSSMFVDLAVKPEADGTTLVSGELTDQAAVHGLFAAIRDLGLTLISVETIAIPWPSAPGTH